MSFAHVDADLSPPHDFIAWCDRLAYFDCPLCIKTGRGWHPTIPGELCSCDGGTVVLYLGDFFANLAIAAGLSACAEVRELRRQRERIATAVRAFREDVEIAVRYNQNRGKGGQQVSPTHEFASALPSTLSSLHRWARTLTMVAGDAKVSLAGKDPTDG